MLYDFGKVLGFSIHPGRDMLYALKTHHPGGVNPVLVTVLWRYQAVGCHQNGPIEGFKLFILFPPCISIVAHKMLIFLKGGVIVSREHFPVGVHVNAGSLGLDKQLLHVLQVMAAYQYPRVVPYADVYPGNLRVPVGGSIGLIKKRHCIHAIFAAFHYQ